MSNPIRDAETTPDMVNHPPHYTSHPSGIEAIQVIEWMSLNVGNAMKYLWRLGHKGDAQEQLSKAIWYLNREKERLEVVALEAAKEDQFWYDEQLTGAGGCPVEDIAAPELENLHNELTRIRHDAAFIQNCQLQEIQALRKQVKKLTRAATPAAPPIKPKGSLAARKAR